MIELLLLMASKIVAKLMDLINVGYIPDGGNQPVISDQRSYPNDIGNPILLANGYPYRRSTIMPESFAGSVASVVLPTGRSNVELNPVAVTTTNVNNAANPVGVYNQIATLNPYTVSGTNVA